MYARPEVQAAFRPKSKTSIIKKVGAINTSEAVIHIVSMIKAVSPAPLRAEEHIIAKESNIDHRARNLIATSARLFMDSNSLGSAFAENG